MEQKVELVGAICGEIGVPMIPLGPGSKEKKAVFEAIIGRLSLPITDGSKPDLAREIAAIGGQDWDSACESTGDTITAVGLERVLSAVRHIRRSSVGRRHEVETEVIGQSYQEAKGGIAAPPADLLVDWDRLDAATRAHADLQNIVAARARAHDLAPLSPRAGEPPFDVAWWLDGRLIVVEVKSTTPDNEVEQVRLGIGQVVEYRHRLIPIVEAEVEAALVVTMASTTWAASTCASVAVLLAEESELEVLDAVMVSDGERTA